jgi:hypothetical protein
MKTHNPQQRLAPGFAQFRRARFVETLRSVTPALHGFAVAQWWRRDAPHPISFLHRRS